MRFDVTVIIASHRKALLSECLSTVKKSASHSDYAVEILVVHDYDLPEKQKQRGVRYVMVNDTSIALKRNVGLQSSETPYVLFTDDDCLVDPFWITLLCNKISNSKESVAAVEGVTKVGNSSRVASIREKNYRRLETPGGRTNNIIYKRSWLEKIGGFDTRFAYQHEDKDVLFALISGGAELVVEPRAIVVHPMRDREYFDYLKMCWRRRYDCLLFKKYPALYRAHVGSPYPKKTLVAAGVQLLATLVLLLSPIRFRAAKKMKHILVPTAMQMVFNPRQMCELISVFLSPGVILIALITGNTKFKSSLWF